LSSTVWVRRKSKGPRPLYLWSPELGPVFLNTDAGQTWILDHAVMFDEHGNEPERSEPEPKPDPEPDPEPKPKTGPDPGTGNEHPGVGFFL
jgi:hypothetical protein